MHCRAVKSRQVKKKAEYVALGVTPEGEREDLGLWIAATEGPEKPVHRTLMAAGLSHPVLRLPACDAQNHLHDGCDRQGFSAVFR